MAILKGRSVQIISVSPPDEATITVANKDGSTSLVRPADLHFTKVELDKISKTSTIVTDPKAPGYNSNYKLIEDKDHQELVDGQDPVKMEAKLKGTKPTTVAVPAQTIKLEPIAGQTLPTPKTNKPFVPNSPTVK